MKKPVHGDLVRVEWRDPQSDSAWVVKSEEDLMPAQCTHIGFFNCIKNRNLYIYASYHGESIGDRTVIPMVLVKNIHILNERKNTSRK